jgi:hypothetical protein
MIKFFYIATFLLFINTRSLEPNTPVTFNKPVTIDKFNPDGYYFTKDSLLFKNYSFGWLAIDVECKNPVAIRLFTSIGKWIDIKSYKYKIDRDSSFFYFKHKSIGEISIEGKFTGKNGPFEDNVEDMKTIVFKGKALINGKSSPLEMT